MPRSRRTPTTISASQNPECESDIRHASASTRLWPVSVRPASCPRPSSTGPSCSAEPSAGRGASARARTWGERRCSDRRETMHTIHEMERLLRTLTAPRRNFYYYGKLLDVPHFQMEQGYENLKRWRLNHLSLGEGVLCGLGITEVDGQVCVDP